MEYLLAFIVDCDYAKKRLAEATDLKEDDRAQIISPIKDAAKSMLKNKAEKDFAEEYVEILRAISKSSSSGISDWITKLLYKYKESSKRISEMLTQKD